MKLISRLSLLFSLLVLPALLQAQAELKALKARDYDQLEQRYEQACREQTTILTSPRIADYFHAFDVAEGSNDAIWEERLVALAHWHGSRPESKAAVLALAQGYIKYGFHARGTGWANDVSEESWAEFHERLQLANKLLLENEANLSGEVEYHYLRAWIFAPQSNDLSETRRHIANLRELNPAYWPAYSLIANYMLERWGSAVGDLERYATEAADALGGEEGDMLYARMLGQACYLDEARFAELHQPNIERLYRGYDAIISNTARDERWRPYHQSGYAYAAAMLGDWERTRRLMVMQHPIYYFYPWNGHENYNVLLERSGALQDLGSIELAELSGRFDEAEARLLKIEPDRTRNFALTGFYLRHARLSDLADCPNAPILDIPIASCSMDQLATYCRLFSALRQTDSAREAALRFDKSRGHNLTGKLALYQIALQSGDPDSIRQTREAIANLKTNRPAYKLVQTILLGDDIDMSKLNWSDPYVFQAATAIALHAYETGRPEDAKALLAKAAGICQDMDQRELIKSLLYHPPLAP